MPIQQIMALAAAAARAAIDYARKDDRGAVTETVILVAVFAALALTVGAIIVLKVTEKANSILTQSPS